MRYVALRGLQVSERSCRWVQFRSNKQIWNLHSIRSEILRNFRLDGVIQPNSENWGVVRNTLESSLSGTAIASTGGPLFLPHLNKRKRVATILNLCDCYVDKQKVDGSNSRKRRPCCTLAAPIVAAACGIAVACILQGFALARSTQHELERNAWRLLAETESMFTESYTILGAMNASQYPFCSEAELSQFRNLIFHSNYFRDAGHMVGGRIACSATLGRENLPRARFDAVATLPDGSKVSNHFTPYESQGENVMSRQMGDSYVVIDPHAVNRLDLITSNRAATLLDAPSHKLIRPGRQLPVVNGVIADKNWQGRVGNTLLVTRCSTLYAVCVTTYANLPEVVSANRGQLIAYASLGGLTGALFGLACLLLYQRNSSMAQQLRRAIRNDRLQVVYQPIVNLSSGRIVGAEALVRWTDKEGFAVGPDVFVKVAEQRGFVGEITRFVMLHAVRDFAETMRNLPAFHLSINMTVGDLENRGLLPMMEGILERAGISPQSLVVEVTETSMVHRDLAIETIGALSKRGYGVHIDDFGTGYSSLSYLHSLSVDAIKIDKSFTQAIGTEAVTVSIIPQILAMAKTLNLQVVVEGIETEVQARYFDSAVQPIFGQGWYFGRPVPAAQFHALLAEVEIHAAPLGAPSLAHVS